MQLLEKYKKEFEHLNNKALEPFLKGLEIVDVDIDDIGEFDPKKTIFTGCKTPPPQVVDYMHAHNVEHFVQVDREGFMYDLFAAAVMLRKPDAFIKNPLPFFISNFKPDPDAPDSVRSTTMTFSSSEEKSPLLHSITDFLEKNKKTSNFLEVVHMMADELIMNATYNAPTDSAGKPLFMNRSRTERVELPEGKKAKLFLTHDDRRLLIGCQDPFGSVNRFKLLTQLEKVFKRDQSSPNEGTGGAGLGCKMMIEASCGFYMVVQKGKSTLACCALPLGVSYMKAERMSKNIHMVFF